METFNIIKNVSDSFSLSIPDEFTEVTTPFRISTGFSFDVATPSLAVTVISQPINIDSTFGISMTATVDVLAVGDEEVEASTGISQINQYGAQTVYKDAVTFVVGSYTVTDGGRSTKIWLPFVVQQDALQQISSATLSLTYATSRIADITKIKIGCENLANSPEPTTYAEMNMKAMTLWQNRGIPIYKTFVPETVYTFNVTGAVQEVLNKATWLAGNTMGILIFDDGSSDDIAKNFYGNSVGKRPVLKIDVP